MEIIDKAIDFIRILRVDESKVSFIKKDGTARIMKCTLDFDKIPKEKRPKGIDITKILSLISKSNLLHVFDLEKKEWRSIPFDRTEYVENGNKKFKISIR